MGKSSPRFKQVSSTAALMVAAFIWGMCFVAQRSGMEHMGPFLFNGLRELLGALTLSLVLIVIWFVARMRGVRSQNDSPAPAVSGKGEYGVIVEPGFPVEIGQQGTTSAASRYSPAGSLKLVLTAGALCGLALYMASNLQQVGMVYVEASKAAFITTFYIVLVPIIGLLLKQKARWNTWVSVGIAMIGLYLLCIGEGFALAPGDAVLLLCALFWAVHILAVGHYAPRLSTLQLFGMCVVQFAVTGVLSLATAPFVDHFFVAAEATLETITYVLPELLYAGVLSTALAFTLMALGQKYAKPTPAAVIMSLESVFGLLGGVVLLGEVLTTGEVIGCALMFVAVVLTQIDFRKQQPGP